MSLAMWFDLGGDASLVVGVVMVMVVTQYQICLKLDWLDQTVGLRPDWTGLLNQQSSPKIKDRTVKQSPFLVRTRLKLL